MYSEKQKTEILSEIFERISNGESLRSVLRSDNMIALPTFFEWIDANEEFANQYARATELRAEKIFEEILEISDTPVEGVVIETDDYGKTKEKRGDMLGHRRLQVDSRKWMLSKMMPKKYGDKLDLEHSGAIKHSHELTPEERKARIEELKLKLSK